MKTETIKYPMGSTTAQGALVYDEKVSGKRPAVLMAPNWLGVTDAAIEPATLDTYLRNAINLSFNRISVDGDTSTNDTVLLLASGASGAAIGAGNAKFATALTQVCTSLARQVVADGEGVSHVVELRINGAASDADALRVAKAIAHSRKNRMGGLRSKLGTSDGRNRLLRRRNQPRSHRHLLRRTADLQKRGPRP